MTPACPTCGAPMTPTGGSRVAEHATVRATLDGPAAWRCPRGHDPLVADPDAAVEETIGLLDVAERTRLRGTLRCAVCSTPYRLPGRRAMRSVTLLGTGLPATRITLDVPVLRCTEDAIESLPPECLDDLRAVVHDLLEPPA